MNDAPTNLTLLLLAGEHTENSFDLISPEKLEDPLLDPFDLSSETGTPCVLFVKKAIPKPPRWAPFFAPPLKEQDLGLTSTAAAVLVIRVGEAWLALTFGHARHLLRQDLIVRGFGLRTTLNSVGEEALRSIDKETFDSIASHSRRQASRDADAGQFGIDAERDLLRAVTGKPEDDFLGPRGSAEWTHLR